MGAGEEEGVTELDDDIVNEEGGPSINCCPVAIPTGLRNLLIRQPLIQITVFCTLGFVASTRTEFCESAPKKRKPTIVDVGKSDGP